jgi:micrococcal nuclease
LEAVLAFGLLVGGILIAYDHFIRKASRAKRRVERLFSQPQPQPQPRIAPKAQQPSAPLKAPSPPVGTVIRGRALIVDGDSLVIQGADIRLFGVDAPELAHPYGKTAKYALIKLCKGQTIRAEVVMTDAHGRTVSRCYLEDGRDLSAEMVKLGLAIDWPKFSGGVYRHLEPADIRRKLWLADARQKGRMDVWEKFESRTRAKGDTAAR